MLSFSLLGGVNLAHAEDNPSVASFTTVTGSVSALHSATKASLVASVGTPALLQDTVITKKRSRTQLKFIDNSMLNMGQNFEMNIKEFTYDETNNVRKAILNAVQGTVEVVVAKLGSETTDFTVETPSAVISVRGTAFYVTITADGRTFITVTEGRVAVRGAGNSNESVMVTANQQFEVPANGILSRSSNGTSPAPATTLTATEMANTRTVLTKATAPNQQVYTDVAAILTAMAAIRAANAANPTAAQGNGNTDTVLKFNDGKGPNSFPGTLAGRSLPVSL